MLWVLCASRSFNVVFSRFRFPSIFRVQRYALYLSLSISLSLPLAYTHPSTKFAIRFLLNMGCRYNFFLHCLVKQNILIDSLLLAHSQAHYVITRSIRGCALALHVTNDGWNIAHRTHTHTHFNFGLADISICNTHGQHTNLITSVTFALSQNNWHFSKSFEWYVQLHWFE